MYLQVLELCLGQCRSSGVGGSKLGLAYESKQEPLTYLQHCTVQTRNPRAHHHHANLINSTTLTTIYSPSSTAIQIPPNHLDKQIDSIQSFYPGTMAPVGPRKRRSESSPGTSSPQRSPIKKRKLGITLAQKQALIENLQLESTCSLGETLRSIA